MLNIYIEKDTPADEITIAGNALLELGKLRASKQPEAETKPPKKTKAQPVTLTTLEPSGALPESASTPEAVTATETTVTPKKPEPVQDLGPEVVEAPEPEVTKPAVADSVLDLVGLRAAIAPIMKDKKDALVALVKEYGESLPKIDPIHYPEILAKAKEL